MSSKYNFETRDQRIERMHQDNPGRSIELCVAVVDGIWDKKREAVRSKIPDRFKNADMQDLGPKEEEIIDSIDSIFASPEDNDKVGLILTGPAGSGKTHAAYALMNLIADINPDMIAYMTGYSSAINGLKTEFASGSHDEMSSIWDRLTNESGMYDGILMVDDVSSQKLTDFELDKLMMILEKRFNEYMPFILTTNVKQEDFISVFGERLASRLYGYCEIIEFESRDMRADNNIQEGL